MVVIYHYFTFQPFIFLLICQPKRSHRMVKTYIYKRSNPLSYLIRANVLVQFRETYLKRPFSNRSNILSCMLPLFSHLYSSFTVFSIWKSLRVLQKAHIKFVARAIYTYLSFSYTFTLRFSWKITSCCDRCFPQQIRPLLNDIYCATILVWGLFSICLTNATYCL